MLRHTIAAGCLALAVSTTGAQAQDIGIPACDTFYKAYETCIMTKVPEAQRATFRQQIDAGRNAMRQAAANPGARPSLEQSCTMQRQQMSQALASYGCKWD
jgi:hypothetical protein